MKRILLRALLVVPLLVAACSGTTRTTEHGAITVLAASSLTDAFTALGIVFERTNPGAHVAFRFGGSAALVEQANNGAPADVIATADEASYGKVDDVGPPTVVARNRLTVIVEKGNPKKIHGLSDLARRDVVTVVCAPSVPCGALAAKALDRARVKVEPKSLEDSVKGVVSKVTLGEADAGIVYATDVRAVAAKADGVDLTTDADLQAVYPVGVLEQAGDVALARAWIRFLATPSGQRILRADGFLPPA